MLGNMTCCLVIILLSSQDPLAFADLKRAALPTLVIACHTLASYVAMIQPAIKAFSELYFQVTFHIAKCRVLTVLASLCVHAAACSKPYICSVPFKLLQRRIMMYLTHYAIIIHTEGPGTSRESSEEESSEEEEFPPDHVLQTAQDEEADTDASPHHGSGALFLGLDRTYLLMIVSIWSIHFHRIVYQHTLSPDIPQILKTTPDILVHCHLWGLHIRCMAAVFSITCL